MGLRQGELPNRHPQTGTQVEDLLALDRPTGGDELPVFLDTGLRLALEVAVLIPPDLATPQPLRIMAACQSELSPVGRGEQRG